jgi:hypothetical protein
MFNVFIKGDVRPPPSWPCRQLTFYRQVALRSIVQRANLTATARTTTCCSTNLYDVHDERGKEQMLSQPHLFALGLQNVVKTMTNHLWSLNERRLQYKHDIQYNVLNGKSGSCFAVCMPDSLSIKATVRKSSAVA